VEAAVVEAEEVREVVTVVALVVVVGLSTLM
jgi:hypothetical protein